MTPLISVFLELSRPVTFGFVSDISSALDSTFENDQNVFVLPMDLLQFEKHEQHVKDVIQYFGKVNVQNHAITWAIIIREF